MKIAVVKSTVYQGGVMSKPILGVDVSKLDLSISLLIDKKYGNYDVHRAWVGISINYDNNTVDSNDDNDDSNDDSNDDIHTNDL